MNTFEMGQGHTDDTDCEMTKKNLDKIRPCLKTSGKVYKVSGD